jgi:hypothetical protein
MHRLQLCGDAGRPAGMADDRCLIRLMEMGLCRRRPDGRFAITPEGALRHTEEIVGSSAKLPDSARR